MVKLSEALHRSAQRGIILDLQIHQIIQIGRKTDSYKT